MLVLVLRHLLHKSTARFSRADTWYVVEIAKWYGMTAADPHGTDEALLGTSVVDVVVKLADGT